MLGACRAAAFFGVQTWKGALDLCTRAVDSHAMKFKRLITALMLLFAVWMPLDNALAAAVVQGCPMMTPAFSQGWQRLWREPPPMSHCTMPGMNGRASDSAELSPMMYHAPGGTLHCSWCLLLGSPALPMAPMASLSATDAPAPVFPLSARVSAIRPAGLFRPPIV